MREEVEVVAEDEDEARDAQVEYIRLVISKPNQLHHPGLKLQAQGEEGSLYSIAENTKPTATMTATAEQELQRRESTLTTTGGLKEVKAMVDGNLALIVVPGTRAETNATIVGRQATGLGTALSKPHFLPTSYQLVRRTTPTSTIPHMRNGTRVSGPTTTTRETRNRRRHTQFSLLLRHFRYANHGDR